MHKQKILQGTLYRSLLTLLIIGLDRIIFSNYVQYYARKYVTIGTKIFECLRFFRCLFMVYYSTMCCYRISLVTSVHVQMVCSLSSSTDFFFKLVCLIHGGLILNSCWYRGWYVIMKSNMQLSKPWITCSDCSRYWLRRFWKCVF